MSTEHLCFLVGIYVRLLWSDWKHMRANSYINCNFVRSGIVALRQALRQALC